MKNFSVINPNNGEVIANLDYMGYKETTIAIEKAAASFYSWKSLLPKQRFVILEKWYNLLVQNREEIAKIVHLELGKPFKEALSEVDYANSFVKFYAMELLQITGEASPYFRDNQWSITIGEPIGVVGAITPWNFPAAMITKKIAPALAAGCPVVLKPAEDTPLSAIKIHQLALDAGIPADVFAIIYGDYEAIGQAMLDSLQVKMISFTGSISVGKYLMEHSAKSVKKLVLELGGNAPCIVMKDADLKLAAEKIALGKFRNSGQACTSPNRIFVHQDILADFTDLLIKEISNDKYEIGPLINKQAKTKTEHLLADSLANGAKILFQCPAKPSELYFAPIILANLNDQMRIVKEEAFSPIFSLLSFEREEEVIARANDTIYGLASYLFTSNLKTGLLIARKLNFGVIGINDTMVAADTTVHGGFNQSGLGREGGKAGLLEYYESKFIVF